MKNKKEEPTLAVVIDRLDTITAVVVKNTGDIAEMKGTILETNKQVHVILSQIDAFSKTVGYFDNRVEFHKLLHDDAKEKIADHEKRISALEQAS